MHEIVNKFLLAGDEFMPEIHLRQPGFTYSACRPFTKNKERIQKFKGTGDLWYICQNELDEVCIQHDMANGDFKDLTRRTNFEKILRDKEFNVAHREKTVLLNSVQEWRLGSFWSFSYVYTIN